MLCKQFLLTTGFILFSAALLADPVIKDGDVAISDAELAGIMQTWTSAMRSSAANDTGERLELLNQIVMSKKIAQQADRLTQESEGYWELKLALESVKQQFMYKRHMRQLELPDIAALTRERYDTGKDKYAKVPETRTSSHILLRCPTGACEREPLRLQAAELVAQLRDGADFEAMVEEYSGDPGSREKGGKFDRWMRFGDPEVTPPYSEALFNIDEVGAYSEPADSQFGVHIIRLDGIRDGGYLPFEDVRDKIASDIYNEYRTLAAKEYRASYMLSDDVFIDGEALEQLLAPYKAPE